MGFPVRKTKKLCYARIKMYFVDLFDPKSRLGMVARTKKSGAHYPGQYDSDQNTSAARTGPSRNAVWAIMVISVTDNSATGTRPLAFVCSHDEP